MKKSRLLDLSLIIFSTLLVLLPITIFSYSFNNYSKVDNINNIDKLEENKTVTKKLQSNIYSSSNVPSSVVGSISISNSDFNSYLTKDDGTYYYLEHNIYDNYDPNGSLTIDSRTNFDSKKTIIYGHSNLNGDGPFNYLQNYHNNYDFFNNHRYIDITYKNNKYRYAIFSVYVALANNDEDENLEYFYNLDYDSDDDYYNALINYKNNSEYETDVDINMDDDILILQTCSMDLNYYEKYYRYNLLIMGKRI